MISETHEAIIPSDAKRSRRIPRSHRKLSHRIGSGAFAPNALGLLCSLDLARNDVYIRRLMPDDISLTCPRCNVPLKEVRTSGGVFYGCDVCGGRAVTIELLRKRFTPESINPLWLDAMRGEGRIGLPCPSCRQPMIGVALSDKAEIDVDVCHHCHFVRFEAHEMDTLAPRATRLCARNQFVRNAPPRSTFGSDEAALGTGSF